MSTEKGERYRRWLRRHSEYEHVPEVDMADCVEVSTYETPPPVKAPSEKERAEIRKYDHLASLADGEPTPGTPIQDRRDWCSARLAEGKSVSWVSMHGCLGRDTVQKLSRGENPRTRKGRTL